MIDLVESTFDYTKDTSSVRRGDGGGEGRSGPLWSPAVPTNEIDTEVRKGDGGGVAGGGPLWRESLGDFPPAVPTSESEQDPSLQETIMTDSLALKQPVVSRTNALTASRQRAYSADLMKAHVALMEKEVILPKQVELFRLVNRHYRTLQMWHDQYTGWRIQRSPSVIRLVRHLSATTPGYLYERLKEPGDFACLTWILWYAENRQLSGRGNDQQFLLSQLAEQIQEQSSGQMGSEAKFDFRRPSDRYSMQRALLTLEELGGLQLVDGQTREWVEQTSDADVLYEFTDVIHSLVTALNPELVSAVSVQLNQNSTTLQPTRLVMEDALNGNLPSTPSQPILMHENVVAPLAGARPVNTWLADARPVHAQLTDTQPVSLPDVRPLVRAWRALLLGPALFRYDDPIAFDALLTNADEVANELIETFGWLLDIHRNYACIVRGSGMSSGPVTSLTPYGSNDQIAMLICRAIRDRVESGAWSKPDAYGCLHVTVEDMTELFYSVRERYGDNWGTEARTRSSKSLLNEVYRKMRQVGLLRGPDETGNILILPTAARYTATYDKAELDTVKGTSKGKPNTNRTKPTSKSKTTPVKVELPGLRTSSRKDSLAVKSVTTKR